MLFNFNGTNVYYEFYGNRLNNPTLLLHGWGRSSEDFNGLVKQFPNRCFLTIDFPPFGKSDKDLVGWSIFTYAQMVMSLCEQLKLSNIDIVAHSFGVRVAIILTAIECSLVHSCIFVGGAGMKPKRNLKYYYKVMRYKLRKRLNRDLSGFGSSDYKALSPEMKKTFVNVVSTHLEDYAKTINVRTLLVWGKNDDQTPVYMAKRLNKLIKSSKLEIVDDSGHFIFLECPFMFYGIVKQFWEETL